MKRLSLTLLISVTCVLTACGQKGPLYLPTPGTPPATQSK